MNDRRTNSTMSTPTKMSSLSQRNTIINPPSEEKSYTNMTSFYGKNSGVEVLTCASIDEMNAVRISAQPSNYWCILVCPKILVLYIFCITNPSEFTVFLK